MRLLFSCTTTMVLQSIKLFKLASQTSCILSPVVGLKNIDTAASGAILRTGCNATR